MKPAPRRSQGPADAEALLQRYARLLVRYGAPGEALGQGRLALQGEAECGPCEGLLLVEDVETGEAVQGTPARAVLVQLAFTLPHGPVDDAQRPAIHALLAYLNPDLGLGAFELDGASDRLRHRTQLLIPAGIPLRDGYLMGPVLESLNTIDRCAALLTAVSAGAVEPAAAYVAHCLHTAELDGAPLDLETRDRLRRLLGRAGAPAGQPAAASGDATAEPSAAPGRPSPDPAALAAALAEPPQRP